MKKKTGKCYTSKAIALDSEGLKFDTNKLRFDLIPPRALEELAAVYTFGASKYADRNWEKGIKFGRIFAAIMRHLWKGWRGSEKDEETGLSHYAHAAWGCFTLFTYTFYKERYETFDDRSDLK